MLLCTSGFDQVEDVYVNLLQDLLVGVLTLVGGKIGDRTRGHTYGDAFFRRLRHTVSLAQTAETTDFLELDQEKLRCSTISEV